MRGLVNLTSGVTAVVAAVLLPAAVLIGAGDQQVVVSMQTRAAPQLDLVGADAEWTPVVSDVLDPDADLELPDPTVSESGSVLGEGAAGGRAPAQVATVTIIDSTAASEPEPTAPAGAVPSTDAEVVDLPGSLGIPGIVLDAYQQAARISREEQPRCEMRWQVLAGIGRIESHHAAGGRVDANGDVDRILGPVLNGRGPFAAIRDTDGGAWDGDTVWDRAVGPMQFIPGTFEAFGVDGNGDGTADPNNIYDAAASAASYLCAGGGAMSVDAELERALRRYNNSSVYVATVMSWIRAYDAGQGYATDTPGREGRPVTEDREERSREDEEPDDASEPTDRPDPDADQPTRPQPPRDEPDPPVPPDPDPGDVDPGDVDPGDPPPPDGGTEDGGSDNGSEDGSEDGGTDNGSEDGGSDNGSEDGGSDNGSEDGGSDDGAEDGGSDNGSEDGGSDNGSEDGGSDDGAEDGGTEDGGSEDGSEDGPGEECPDPSGEDGATEDGAAEDGAADDGDPGDVPECTPGDEDGAAEDGGSDDGATEDGATEDGVTEEGATNAPTHGGAAGR